MPPRNLVAAETAERNRSGEGLLSRGGYTFNTIPPGDYEGVVFTVAVLRLGDHAHLDVQSGRCVAGHDGSTFSQRLHVGQAGRLILRWYEWEVLRDLLEPHECIRIAEVERPTDGQLKYHVGNPDRKEEGKCHSSS